MKSIPWRYGRLVWVEDCGPRPHWHVVQVNSHVCLGEDGALSLAGALVRSCFRRGKCKQGRGHLGPCDDWKGSECRS